MKHLKRFNEELRPDKYERVSKKLHYLGHPTRAKSLADWAAKKRDEEYQKKLKEKLARVTPFGTYTLDIYQSEWNSQTKKSQKVKLFTREFYLEPSFEGSWASDTAYDWFQGYNDVFYLPFEIGIIPSDEECLERCKGFIPSFRDDFHEGTLWGQQMAIRINDRGIFNVNPNIDPIDYDWSGRENWTFKFSTRKDAVRFRNNFIGSIEGKNNWGSRFQPNGLGEYLKQFLKGLQEDFPTWIEIDGYKNATNVETCPIGEKDFDAIVQRIKRLSINPMYSPT